jgi:hypothetical protein
MEAEARGAAVNELPRSEKDLFSRHTDRIIDALETHELDFHGYAVLSFLVDAIARPGRKGKIAYTLDGLIGVLQWPYSAEYLRRTLRQLAERRWIEIDDVRRGPRAPWIFRLARGAIDSDIAEPEMSFNRVSNSEAPPGLKLVSTEPAAPGAANPVPERDSAPSEFQTDAVFEAEEKRREENASSEEKEDHHVGKTTGESENSAEFLAEERLFELGTLPLGELRHRYEAGEL